MAEDQYLDLTTETKRVEHFNKKVEEFKKESPDTAEVSKETFDMARQYAQHSVFPPFGFISFPDDPKNPMGDEMGIGIAAGRVLFGAARFINYLKKDSPEDLIQKGIDTYKGFDDSVAVNELTGATRMSFATVKGGLQEIKSAISADDKSADDPFEDSPILSKLKPDDIENLLDSTVLKFIKELGLKRADEASDKPILDKGEASFTKAKELAAKTNTLAPKNIQESKLNTKDDPEYMARLEKSRKEDELMDSVSMSKTGGKIVTGESKKTEAKPEGIKATETPVTPQSPAQPQSTPAPTVIEKSQTNVTNNNVTSNALSVLQDPDAKPAPILKSETPVKAPEIKQEAAVKTDIKKDATPASTNPPVGVTKAETTPTALADKSSVSDEETPLLKMLGESMGMKADDIAKMFVGKEDNLQKGLDLTFGGEEQPSQPIASPVQALSTENIKPEVAGQAQKIAQQATSIAATTKISEPVKIVESAPIPKQETPPASNPEPSPPAAVQSEQTSTESAGAEVKDSAPPETKPPGEDINKETGPSNDDLLKVMKEILKTLQGPLIVTESTPKFS